MVILRRFDGATGFSKPTRRVVPLPKLDETSKPVETPNSISTSLPVKRITPPSKRKDPFVEKIRSEHRSDDESEPGKKDRDKSEDVDHLENGGMEEDEEMGGDEGLELAVRKPLGPAALIKFLETTPCATLRRINTILPEDLPTAPKAFRFECQSDVVDLGKTSKFAGKCWDVSFNRDGNLVSKELKARAEPLVEELEPDQKPETKKTPCKVPNIKLPRFSKWNAIVFCALLEIGRPATASEIISHITSRFGEKFGKNLIYYSLKILQNYDLILAEVGSKTLASGLERDVLLYYPNTHILCLATDLIGRMHKYWQDVTSVSVAITASSSHEKLPTPNSSHKPGRKSRSIAGLDGIIFYSILDLAKHKSEFTLPDLLAHTMSSLGGDIASRTAIRTLMDDFVLRGIVVRREFVSSGIKHIYSLAPDWRERCGTLEQEARICWEIESNPVRKPGTVILKALGHALALHAIIMLHQTNDEPPKAVDVFKYIHTELGDHITYSHRIIDKMIASLERDGLIIKKRDLSVPGTSTFCHLADHPDLEKIKLQVALDWKREIGLRAIRLGSVNQVG
ncbi:hypothetical protein KKF81_04995 [Candidatus Micrarchaeota archaeon]|nr:hypothetical protein [Candidatus Micrarchaeota archaeon]